MVPDVHGAQVLALTIGLGQSRGAIGLRTGPAPRDHHQRGVPTLKTSSAAKRGTPRAFPL
jgi:hypothetical protein